MSHSACENRLEKEAAVESQKRWGTRKQLVVFFGNARIGTRGGWGAKAVLQACRKVVERANSGKWQHRGAAPAKGREYPALGCKGLQRSAEHAARWGEHVVPTGAVLVARAGSSAKLGQGVTRPGLQGAARPAAQGPAAAACCGTVLCPHLSCHQLTNSACRSRQI
ncbi:hypothetical protein HaLaN_13016 [Haematococcus lacustris]|uniref:Uncharacterized protein n=1 Tax=Haematococcus lacustris TaxID=44745 RepID=A0A699Z205_HAELA|nr:hypothetical protein HaLaN_13016 [Haematococcus lacustris]